MTQTTTRKPLMQDLIKEAAANGARQAAASSPKTAGDGASGKPDDKKKSEKDANGPGCETKVAALSSESVEKLANALESVLPQLGEALKLAESPPLPPGVTPTSSPAAPPGLARPSGQGSAHQQPPSPGVQKAEPQEHAPTQMKNDMSSPPGAGQRQQVALSGAGGKTAGVKQALLDYLVARQLGRNKAEEAGMDPDPAGRDAMLGYGGGSLAGQLGGMALGAGAGHLLGRGAPNAALTGAIGGGLIGGPVGGVLGYKHQTAKYNPDPAAKEASVAGQIRRIPMRVGEEIGKVTGHHYDHDKAVGAAALGAGALGLGAAAHAATKKKEASDLSEEELSFVGLLRHKQAEDAINPAHISAGSAKAPETNTSDQPAPSYPGGPPKGPTGLIGSNQSAINYTKGQAYAPRKDELGVLFRERALSASTDSTLQQAFSHTREAGPKIAEAELATKSAAARLLIERIREGQQPAAKE